METETRPDRSVRLWYPVAKKVAIVSGAFVLLLSALIVVNYVQIETTDPLNSEALTQLMRQLREAPGDEALKAQIRALDLLARRAYFTHQWQLRTGSYLLFGLTLVFLLALKYIHSLKPRLPDLEAGPERGAAWEDRILARKSLIFSGLGLFAAAFILSAISESSLSSIGTDSAADSAYAGPEEIRQQWPNFRGPEGNGIAYHTDVPTRWDGPSGENILWKVPVPMPGFSSPIVWGGKLFLSGADEDVQEVYCYEAESGELLWQGDANDLPESPSERPDVTDDTGYAAPTMATDGQRVFAIFATGDLACWDFDGNRLWGKNLGMPENHYGHSSSLMTYRNLVLVQFDDSSGGSLKAFDAGTGDPIYDRSREVEISWASPILVNTGSRMEIILNSNPSVISYDPLTGKELWQVECMMGEVAPSPVYAGGMVYAVNDNAILAAIRVGETAEVVWESDEYLSEVASPVVTGEFLIIPTSYGTVACYHSKTGEELWYHDFDEGFYSSPILVGELIYLMDLGGMMYIFKAGGEFELVDRCPLGEGAFATPAFVGNRIYIRGSEHLFCIGE